MENTKKKINGFIFILLMLVGYSLSAQVDPLSVVSQDVESFVSQLKNENYSSIFLPDFDARHIPFLLEYIDQDQKIYTFPVNPLSSFKQDECQLGIFVMWVIESIRLRAIEMRPAKIEWYPSNNPMIQRYIRPDFWKANTRGIHITASKAYKQWWEAAKTPEEKFAENPLQGTKLSWR